MSGRAGHAGFVGQHGDEFVTGVEVRIGRTLSGASGKCSTQFWAISQGGA